MKTVAQTEAEIRRRHIKVFKAAVKFQETSNDKKAVVRYWNGDRWPPNGMRGIIARLEAEAEELENA